MPEQIKRQTAYKLRIGDILKGKPILEQVQENPEHPRFKFLELGNKTIIRVNIVANVVDKYSNEGASSFASENSSSIPSETAGKKYLSFTIDDASGQIRLKIFGEDTSRFLNITQGNTVMIIGTLRFYSNEIYIQPEIIKVADPRYLLVRKLELDKEKPKEVKKEEIKAIKDQIIDMIKSGENNGGIDSDTIYHTLTSISPDILSQEITKLLEEGLIYEPKPGKIRYLG
jgi:RPA family protein